MGLTHDKDGTDRKPTNADLDCERLRLACDIKRLSGSRKTLTATLIGAEPYDAMLVPLLPRCLFPTLLGLAQPLRHLLVLRRVICPTLCGTVPAIIFNCHVD